jgi:hypothetical protein
MPPIPHQLPIPGHHLPPDHHHLDARWRGVGAFRRRIVSHRSRVKEDQVGPMPLGDAPDPVQAGPLG